MQGILGDGAGGGSPRRWRRGLPIQFLPRQLRFDCGSEQLAGIQQDGDRAIVHQFDFHHCLESAGRDVQARGADFRDEVLVEFVGPLGAGGGIEGRALAAAHGDD